MKKKTVADKGCLVLHGEVVLTGNASPENGAELEESLLVAD
jgi:hypothetical protein